VKLHCFTTGQARLKAGERGVRRYLLDNWRDETIPVNVFLIEHPAGLCLFDAGQTARAAEPGYFPRWYPFFRLARFELGPQDEAAPQLERLGFKAQDVRWVVLSHLHTDHVGGLADFGTAEVVVSREEWQRATGVHGRLRGYLPQYWPAGLEPRLIDFSAPANGLPVASVDLAGDGRLVLVPTPGHTPGHMGLLVRAGDRSYLLGGDVVHSADELSTGAPWLQRLCERENAVLLATHDPGADQLVAGG
jgi:glyoxylase-like metal-dependent hydrolase (beta-lactamase superfamily II)